MSTEIKPGQVWASMHNAAETATVREVRGNEVWATDDQSGAHFVRASLGFRCDYELVKEPPAPLDPSKVKAGDTVTVRVDADPKNGGTYEVTGNAYMDHGPFGGAGILKVGAYSLDGYNVTLTAHQPAPEPEPEWKPGTVVKGTVVVDQTHDAVELDHDVQMMRVTHIDTVGRAYVSAGGDIIEPRHVTDVRPLVVIDPATVDIEALQYAAEKAQGRNTSDALAGAKAFLAGLGIEAP